MADSLDQEQRQPLTAPRSPEIATPATAAQTPTQTTPTRHRIGYARAPSVSFLDERLTKGAMERTDERQITSGPKDATTGHGLGIDVRTPSPSKTPQVNVQTIRRTPVGRKSTSDQRTPDSGKPLLSPPSTGGLSGSTSYDVAFDDFNFDTSYMGAKSMANQSTPSFQSVNAPSEYPSSTKNLLHKSTTSSMQQRFNEFTPRHVCSSSTHFKRGMNNWLAITIVLLSIFSTAFSGIFLGIALNGPRYSDFIGKDGKLTISSAAFLTSFFAKMIELSFVTVVVAFLGQSLTRRAYRKEADPGVTLAEMSMRSWIVQPGTMFTHWETVRYASGSLLGVIALIAAIVALLYTSAATALVQPQLKFSGWEKRLLQAPVMTSFANTNYLQQTCKTPITTALDDEEDITNTCIQIEHASQAYHNYMHWIGTWTDVAFGGNGTRDLSTRPPGWALLNDNTTVTAPWINQKDPYLWHDTRWVINNITMAMPHPGVVSAAIDPGNDIMQPNEMNGLGIYSIRASVPVPYVNVICAMGLSKSDLKPVVYELWDNAEPISDYGTWPHQLENARYDYPYLGGTPFDDVFKWGEKHGDKNWPPIFAKVPEDYNTLINDTTEVAGPGNMGYGRTSVYILGKGGDVDAMGFATKDNYALCELRVGQTPHCFTQYNASSSVGTLEAICEDPNDDMRYIKSMTNATGVLSADWPNVASMWLRSINMNSGLLNSNSSNARLWTEFILTYSNSSINWETNGVQLSMALPSPAEALAVMSGCTLLQSAQDAPFVLFWDYSSPYLNAPQIQYFNASVRAQQYASGGMPGYQRGFHLILFTDFVINIIVLVYWFVHREWYTDFSDPTNLFSLAINSPPSEKLAECTCGGGERSGERFRYGWKLGREDGHVFMESPEFNEMEESPELKRQRGFSETYEMVKSPVVKVTERFRRKSNA